MRRVAVVGPGGAGKSTGRHRERLRIVELRSRREAAAFLDRLADPPQRPGA